jgi:hypothetical protein
MKVKTAVTEKKVAANRENAKRSTGPRTARGKNTSRFNAMKTGLFATFVVIPRFDVAFDLEPERRFSRLVESLSQEYKPEGPSESFYVLQMAECMWRQRRVSGSETSLMQQRARQQLESVNFHGDLVELFKAEISTLEKALEEIKTTRALSSASVASLRSLMLADYVGPEMEELELDPDSENPAQVKDELVALIEGARDRLLGGQVKVLEKYRAVLYDAECAFPDEKVLDQILRYEKALQKKFDWTLQRLLESKARRRQGRPSARIHVIK